MRLAVNGRFYGARVTGVQRFAREVTARLRERADVTLFLPRNVSAAAVPGRGPIVRGVLPGRVWEQLELPWRARALRVRPVLHLGGSASRWGGPHVVMVHDLTPLTHPEWFTRAFVSWFRFALGGAARRAAHVLVPSDWSRREASRVLAIPPERVTVVSQGVAPFDRPAVPDDVRRVRARWALTEPYVLATGDGDPRKNLPFLVDVLAGLDGRRPALVVVGGAHRRLHRSAALAASRVDVRRVGVVSDDDLRALYTGAAVYCSPSLAEGFGRTPLEAMACGTPALVGDYGAAAEVVGDGATIVPLDVQAWRAALTRLLCDQAGRAAAIARGRERARRCSWDDAASDVLRACERVAVGGSR